MTCSVKICGLTSSEAIDAAVEAGADMVGFVFFPPSPRSLTIEAAAALAKRVPDRVNRVALSVDADNALLAAIAMEVRPDMMQLHGQETPERVTEVRELWQLPVMKAVAISGSTDVDRAHDYLAVADWLMFDAKPPQDATRPGGNAVVFDWSLIGAKDWGVPWILAGGLTPSNVTEAIVASGASAVDVSSGVENNTGIKDTEKIFEFVTAAKGTELQSC